MFSIMLCLCLIQNILYLFRKAAKSYVSNVGVVFSPRFATAQLIASICVYYASIHLNQFIFHLN